MTKELTIVSPSQGGLLKYMEQVNKFPILSEEEEFKHARNVKEFNDNNSAKILITSHLRFVVKIAMSFKNYGLPVYDLISEGNIGLMKAVKKFDPDKGFRLSTYAMWWIKSSMQEYVLKSWSLVKIGTTAAQKKLFFNLKKVKQRIMDYSKSDYYLDDSQVKTVANYLGVDENEVVEMDKRLQGNDLSLNTPVSDNDASYEILDTLEASDATQEVLAIENQESNSRLTQLSTALENLNEREKDILFSRRLTDKPLTLEDLSIKYNISKERVRQIEARVIEKLKNKILN